jgi:uncharacterized protein YbjT (DUF2867 family)
VLDGRWPVRALVRDPNAKAASALADPDPERFHGLRLELAGDELAPAAAAIAEATVRRVRFEQVRQEEGRSWVRILRGLGMSRTATGLGPQTFPHSANSTPDCRRSTPG